MKKGLILVFAVLAIICVVIAKSSVINRGLSTTVPSATEEQSQATLPSLDNFPAEIDNSYDDTFNAVRKATLIKDEKEIELKPDDSRLCRFLNLCAYSQENNLSAWSQGEVNNLYKSYEYDMRLVVEFSDVKSTSCLGKLSLYDKAVIAGKTVWLIQTKPLHPTIYSDQSVMNFIPVADVFLLDDNSISIPEYIGF